MRYSVENTKINAPMKILLFGISPKKMYAKIAATINSIYLNGARKDKSLASYALKIKNCIKLLPHPSKNKKNNSFKVGVCQKYIAGMALKTDVIIAKYISIVKNFSFATMCLIMTSCTENNIADSSGKSEMIVHDMVRLFSDAIMTSEPTKPIKVATHRSNDTFSCSHNLEKSTLNNGIVQHKATTCESGSVMIEKMKAAKLKNPKVPRKKCRR